MEDGVPVGRTMQSKARKNYKRSVGKSASSSSRRKLGSGGRYYAGSYKGYGPGVGPAPKFGGAGVAKPITTPFGKLPAGNYNLPGKGFPWGKFVGRAAGAAGFGFAAWGAWRDFQFAYMKPGGEPEYPYGEYSTDKWRDLGRGWWVVFGGAENADWRLVSRYDPLVSFNPGFESYQPSYQISLPKGSPSSLNDNASYSSEFMNALPEPYWRSEGQYYERSSMWTATRAYYIDAMPVPEWGQHMKSVTFREWSPKTLPIPDTPAPTAMHVQPTPENWPSIQPEAVPAVMPWDVWYPAPRWEEQFDYQKALESAPENITPWPKGQTYPGTNAGVFPEGVVIASPQPNARPSPQQDPAEGVRERKFKSHNAWLLGAFKVTQKGFHALTEYQDAVDAVYDALPKKLRRALKKKYEGDPNVAQKTWEIYQNFGKIDGAEAIKNLAENHIEDYVIGKGFKGIEDAAKRLGIKGAYKLEQPVMEAINYLRGYSS